MLEEVVKGLLKGKLESVPEDKQDLIPDGTPEDQLAWLAKAEAKGLFGKAQAPDIHARSGTGGGGRATARVQEEALKAEVKKRYGLKPDKDW